MKDYQNNILGESDPTGSNEGQVEITATSSDKLLILNAAARVDDDGDTPPEPAASDPVGARRLNLSFVRSTDEAAPDAQDDDFEDLQSSSLYSFVKGNVVRTEVDKPAEPKGLWRRMSGALRPRGTAPVLVLTDTEKVGEPADLSSAAAFFETKSTDPDPAPEATAQAPVATPVAAPDVKDTAPAQEPAAEPAQTDAGQQNTAQDAEIPPKVDDVAADTATEAKADDAQARGAEDAPPQPEAQPTEARDTTSNNNAVGETIEGDTGPLIRKGDDVPATGGGSGGSGQPPKFHKRLGPMDFEDSLKKGVRAISKNFAFVLVLTFATNILILAIPVYLFQISDRVLTSRSIDTLIMLTIVIAGAVVLQTVFDAIRRFILMRTAVEIAARLGAPILTKAAKAALHSNGREYQTLGDLQQLRSFLVSGTLLAFLDVPFAPLLTLGIFMVHPHLGSIVIATSLALLVIAIINQRVTKKPFAEANMAQSKANLHLDSMSRNSQIINAMSMIPEAVNIWGKDTADSLTSQVRAQDRNIISAAASRAVRLLTQIAMLGWGAYLAIDGQITGGMVIAASIIAGRALTPIEGAIEGWNSFVLSQAAFQRIRNLLRNDQIVFDRLNLPRPEGRLDVERLLFVPSGTKNVVLNGISFSLNPGETLAIIGNSGAGKTTLGKMLVGSIMPTSGNVRLDLMDIRNWDTRQFGENIGYLPQDVQLFPGTIKQNIGRMREDATDAEIFNAAELADVHEMIATLPQGYETFVAADGSPLSGGQKQRIALARAFFGNPRFVVLDEPNSNLDTNGDKALAKAIRRAQEQNITVVVVTQKPSLLSIVDKIMLLADGDIQLFGDRIPVLEKLAGRSNKAKPVQNNQQNKQVGNQDGT